MKTKTTLRVENKQFELGQLESQDIDRLIEIATHWVKDRFTGKVETEELASIRSRMENCPTNGYIYYVIRNESREAIGCCAIREPEEAMQQFKSSPITKSVELVNVFLDDDYRGKGLGYRLMNYMFEKAKELGNDEVVWNSGPRYRNSAWEFYTKLVGEPFDFAKAFYGFAPDGTPNDAPVWRKDLV